MRTVAGIIAGVVLGGSAVAAWAHPSVGGSTAAVRMECAQGSVLSVLQDNERTARLRCSVPVTPLPTLTPHPPLPTRPAQ